GVNFVRSIKPSRASRLGRPPPAFNLGFRGVQRQHLFDNQNRQWDFITSFSPALPRAAGTPGPSCPLYVNRPSSHLSAVSRGGIGVCRWSSPPPIDLRQAYEGSQTARDAAHRGKTRPPHWVTLKALLVARRV